MKKGLLCAGFIMLAGPVFAQTLTADVKYSDAKNKFSISYVKGFALKKAGQSVEFISSDKGLVVTVTVFTASDAAKIAKKAGKSAADTLVMLKSILDSQKVVRDLDPAMHNLPEEAVAPSKAAAGSAIKYSMKKGNAGYACRTVVYAKGGNFVSVGYSILEKKGNEKYEKLAGAMLKSFSFAE